MTEDDFQEEVRRIHRTRPNFKPADIKDYLEGGGLRAKIDYRTGFTRIKEHQMQTIFRCRRISAPFWECTNTHLKNVVFEHTDLQIVSLVKEEIDEVYSGRCKDIHSLGIQEWLSARDRARAGRGSGSLDQQSGHETDTEVVVGEPREEGCG